MPRDTAPVAATTLAIARHTAPASLPPSHRKQNAPCFKSLNQKISNPPSFALTKRQWCRKKSQMTEEQEAQNGVRFSWNAFPTSAAAAKQALIVPLGVMYTPMKNTPAVLQVPYEPVVCRQCNAVLNPYCPLEVGTKTWQCPFCLQRTQLPPQYNGISETSLPAEVYQQYSTIEYVLPRPVVSTPAFLMVVDLCVDADDFAPMKEGLLQFVSLLPEDARIGLITFGANVSLYDLSSKDCPKSYVFAGAAPLTVERVKELLFPVQESGCGFLVPLKECEFVLTSLLEDLERDPWPVAAGQRPLRATGAALAVATGVLEQLCRGVGGRIVSFISGPCTCGQGLVVSPELKENIRSHHDIRKGVAPHLKASTAFYESLGRHLVANGHTHDTFMCSLDQCGLYEQQEMFVKTGGLIMLTPTFGNEMFAKSVLKCYERNEQNEMSLAFNATLELHTSRGLKVCGCIGHCNSLHNKTPCVSEAELGVGGTNAWRMSSLDPRTTLAFYLQVSAGEQEALAPGTLGLVQFVTHYQLSSGKYVLRVTTVGRPFVDPATRPLDLSASFDQEAATALMARVATLKAGREEPHDVLRWLDRMLIALCKRYGTYTSGDPNTFALPPAFSLYPGFMFHLRRSNYIQPFNNTPDESVWYRYVLNRECVSNAVVMVQPQLDSYVMGTPEPVPAPLSAASIVPESILLMDSFFFVVVFYGHRVAQWRAEGYAELPEHAEFKRVVTQPVIDARELMKDRFPYPKYIECNQYSGDSRFLTSVVDPDVTHNSAGASGEAVFTEDVNLAVFMNHLKKLVVQQQN